MLPLPEKKEGPPGAKPLPSWSPFFSRRKRVKPCPPAVFSPRTLGEFQKAAVAMPHHLYNISKPPPPDPSGRVPGTVWAPEPRTARKPVGISGAQPTPLKQTLSTMLTEPAVRSPHGPWPLEIHPHQWLTRHHPKGSAPRVCRGRSALPPQSMPTWGESAPLDQD